MQLEKAKFYVTITFYANEYQLFSTVKMYTDYFYFPA